MKRFVFDPIGVAAGLRPKEANHGQKSDPYSSGVTKFTQNHVENHHRIRKRNISALSKFSDIRDPPRLATLMNVSDVSMRTVFYACMFLYGLSVLWGKDWLWDSRLCFVDFPFHDLPKDIRRYYLVEMGFYIFLLESEGLERKRTEFWVELFHHTVTLVLLVLSFCIHGHRVGSIVLLLHNPHAVLILLINQDGEHPCPHHSRFMKASLTEHKNDVGGSLSFQASKAMKHLSKPNWSNILLMLTTVVFLASRIILFPCLILLPADSMREPLGACLSSNHNPRRRFPANTLTAGGYMDEYTSTQVLILTHTQEYQDDSLVPPPVPEPREEE
ncbi:unnamed protein product [Darwinula stevensoni]|uniref:TLC domain-containing protein n=1 Tax=Darwinula stevensoni TaxID=69355 RepID=A0A7R8XJ56_9CRUS|nr:unnamed protein product [Darwinula stevensoni]CAG0894968.1 unnamed protein product [Darwinula stevensoni]